MIPDHATNDTARSRYEEVKSRALCAALRLFLLLAGTVALFPTGAWLMLVATGWPQWGGGLFCAVAAMLASGVPDEFNRVERLGREAERLKCQVISDQ